MGLEGKTERESKCDRDSKRERERVVSVRRSDK